MNEILGAEGTASNGVLEYGITRSDLHIDGPGGVPLKDGFQIEHDVFFQRLRDGDAMVNGDFALKPSELNIANDFDWEIGCLYNQETDEHPQLYFSHTWKVGDPVDLAKQVRKGLDQTNAES